MAINFQNLEYFSVSARLGSYRAAAEQLFRSYQGVYQGVRQLETDLGHPLFLQDRGRLEVTEFGRFALETYVEPILTQYRQMLDCYADFARFRETTLTVALNTHHQDALQIGTEAADILRKRHPQADILCREEGPREVMCLVREGAADLGYFLRTPSTNDLTPCLTASVELCLYVSPRHPLAGRESVTVKDIEKETFLFFNPATYQKMSFWELSGLSPTQAMVANSRNPVIQTLFQEGKLVRVFPRADSVRDGQNDFLSQSLCLPFNPPMRVEICFFTPPDQPPKALTIEYLRIFRNLYIRQGRGQCEIAPGWEGGNHTQYDTQSKAKQT